jgi:hypothetical protein
VVFVAHDEQRLDVARRRDDDWVVAQARAGGRITLDSLGCELTVADVYRDPLAS